jgi:hypothetical protein
MQNQDRLLRFSFTATSHGWSLQCHPYRTGIGYLILVSCQKRLD